MWSNLKMTKANERFSLLVACTLCKVNAKLNMNLVVCMLNAMAAHVCKLMEQAKFGRSEWVEDGEIATQVKKHALQWLLPKVYFFILLALALNVVRARCNKLRDDFRGKDAAEVERGWWGDIVVLFCRKCREFELLMNGFELWGNWMHFNLHLIIIGSGCSSEGWRSEFCESSLEFMVWRMKFEFV